MKTDSRTALVKILGAEIRQLRTGLSLSQAEFSKRAKIPQSRISAIEAGEANLTLSTLLSIASALKKSLIVRFE